MTSVLILQELLPPYRVPIFNRIARLPGVSLTIGHVAPYDASDADAFETVRYSAVRGRFFVRADIDAAFDLDQFELVIAMFNLRWLDLMRLSTRRRAYALAYWGIGVSTSAGFGHRRSLDWVRVKAARRADAVILYSERSRSAYDLAGIPPEKIFIAENTVEVDSPRALGAEGEQSSFLFLGSLRPNKGLEDLLVAFAEASPMFERPIMLDIVGDGSERAVLEELVAKLHLDEQVRFHGARHALSELEPFFSRAIACISPRQAGLSVPLAMAHGVPFVTRRDAITGGERFHIVNGLNGIDYEGGTRVLAQELVRLANDQALARRLGRNAVAHYVEFASADKMIGEFRRVIETVTAHR